VLNTGNAAILVFHLISLYVRLERASIVLTQIKDGTGFYAYLRFLGDSHSGFPLRGRTVGFVWLQVVLLGVVQDQNFNH
jgi:hypothetical protein